MTTLTEATETYVTRLEALKAFQTDISTYAKEVNTRAADFWSQVEARPQRRKPPENPMPSALSDMLHHWNVLMPENGSVEKALVARKQKLKQDVLQAGAAIEDSLRAHLDTLPTNIESPVETKAVAEKDMADLEENMHKLRQAVDAVDLGRIDSDSEAKSRFLARWAKESTVK